MLRKGEDATIKYLKEKTEPFETENFEFVPIAIFSLSDTTVHVIINLFIMSPGQDITELVISRNRGSLHEMSYVVLYLEINFDIPRASEPNYMKDVFQNSRVGMEIIVDSNQVRDRFTEQFREQQEEVLLDLVESQFSEYFAFYNRIQEYTSAFSLKS